MREDEDHHSTKLSKVSLLVIVWVTHAFSASFPGTPPYSLMMSKYAMLVLLPNWYQ